MPLADWQIRKLALTGMIDPFEESQQQKGVISHGLGSYGYDSRLGYKFKVFTDVYGAEVDPKAFDPRAFVDVDLTPVKHQWAHDIVGPNGQQFRCVKCESWTHHPETFPSQCGHAPNFIRIPPNSFALGESVETFRIPRDVLAICLGKSTYARCGLVINVTPLEPEWQGKVTIEISNTTPLPARVYAGEGIMQVIFLRADGEACSTSYADKKGKYMDQTGLTLPFVEGGE